MSLWILMFCIAPCFPAFEPEERSETATILLIGEASTSSKSTPAGLERAAWVEEFLHLGGLEDVEVRESDDAATVAGARERVALYREAAPACVVLRFGLADALDGSPGAFLDEYGKLIDDLSEALPRAKILLATPAPVGADHPRAGDAAFQSTGGLGAYLEKHFVEPVRQLAARRNLPLVDQHLLVHRAKERGQAMFESDGSSLTARGRILAAQHTALWILHSMERRADPPTVEVVLASLSGKEARAVRDDVGFDDDGGEPDLPLEPFRAFFEEKLEARLEARLEEEDSDVRWSALEALLDMRLEPPTDEHLQRLVELCLDRDSNVANRARGRLDQLSASSTELNQRLAALLFEKIRAEGLDSPVASTLLSRLLDVVNRRDQMTRPRPVPAGGQPDEGEAKDPLFSEEQLELLATGLASRDDEVRGLVLRLLLGSRSAGVDFVFVEIRTGSEWQAIELLKEIFSRRPRGGGQGADLDQACMSLLKQDDRRRIRELVLAHLFSFASTVEIGVELLREALLSEDDYLRSHAAGELVRREREGLTILEEALRSPNRDLQKVARDAVFALVLRAESEEVARDAFQRLLASRDQPTEPSVLELIEDRVNSGVLRISTGPGVSRIVTSRTRSIRSSRGLRGRRTTWQRAEIPGDLPVRPERCVLFLPFLEKLLEKGTVDEKERAEDILVNLAKAAVVEKQTAERSAPRAVLARAARRATPRPPAPPVELIDTIDSPRSLGRLLRSRARECYQEKDWAGYLAGLRRAIAADPNEIEYSDDLAWFLATTDVESLADPAEAERICRDALEKGGRKVGLLAGLAASLARQGRFEEAADVQFEAVSRTDKESKGFQLERLVLYLEKRPLIVKR